MSKHTNKLTPSQIEHFRVRLEAMRVALRAPIADAEQELAAPDTISVAELDLADTAACCLRMSSCLIRLRASRQNWPKLSGRWPALSLVHTG